MACQRTPRPWPSLTAGFGLHKVIQDGNVITTLSISLVWIFYSMIPPYLLLHYHFIGKGHTLRYASRICYLLSFLCAAAAIVLLWLVYPRNVSAPRTSIASAVHASEPWRSPRCFSAEVAICSRCPRLLNVGTGRRARTACC